MQVGALIAILFTVGAVHPASAASYKVNVSRGGLNLYSVTGQNLLIVTHGCREKVDHVDAVLRMSGSSGEITFTDRGGKCAVAAVYEPAKMKAGRYSVSVRRGESDWYEILGSGAFLRTSMCLNLSSVKEVILTVTSAGNGEIVSGEDGERCMVEGVYKRRRM